MSISRGISCAMGIRGLTTYIDHHPELLTDHKLRDTKLIIDGNNLYHFLYYYYRVAHEFGGDYDHFSDSCISFFTSLRSCNVEPYVVFDGAYATDGCKFQTSMGRARDRIRLSRLVATGVSAKLLPILAHDVFCSTLKRLKIPHVMCDFEADRQVAALANQWQCPVLTNDSDFFIFNVNAGVILLDYVDVLVHKERSENGSSQYLKVQIFFCNDLMRSLKLTDHSLIVLFATLLGNDIVDSNSFDSFFARVKLPKSSNRHSTAKRQVKISSLIEWLQMVHSIEDAVSHVLANISHDQRDKIKCLIQKSLACYTDLESNLHQYFESECVASELNLSTYNGNLLPEWFKFRIQSCDVPVALINVVASRRLLLLSQVELTKETSTYYCSRFIRQVAYGIILTLDLPDPATSLQCNNIIVSEYDREQKNMQRIAVEPVWLVNDEPVPDLRCVQQLEPNRRFKFMLQVLGAKCDGSERFPSDVQLLVALVRYWILHSHPKVTKLHVVAMLLCFLKLGALDNFVLSDSHTSFDDCIGPQQLTNIVVSSSCFDRTNDDKLLEVKKEECELVQSRTFRSEQLIKAKQSLSKFDATPRHNHAHVFDAAVVHSFCQFQTCLQAAGFLGKLLCLSQLVVEAMNALSGTVLYNIVRDLRSRRNADLYVSDLLGHSSPVWDCYCVLIMAICSDLPAESLKRVTEIVRKKNKGKKVLNVPNDVKVEESEGEQSPEESVSETGQFGQSINCDIKNKFTLLSFAES